MPYNNKEIVLQDFGLLVAQYNTTLPTLTNGEFTELQVDANGRLLVQADVTVLVDFLGLNGAGDSSNILIVGTEDGTSGGTAHVVRLGPDGSVITETTITVEGTEQYSVTDAEADGGDGLIAVTTTFTTVSTSAIGAGESAFIYGWQFSCDKNAVGRIVKKEGATTEVLKISQVVSSNPNYAEHWHKEGRIEKAFAAAGTIEVQVQSKQGNAQASGSVHIRKK